MTGQDLALAEAISRLGQNDFPAALSGWLATCLAFDNVVMVAYFAEAQPMMLYAKGRKPNFLPNLGSYVSGTYRLDPFHQIHVRRRPDGLYRLSSVAPDHFQRSRYYVEYYKSTDMQDELAFATRLATGASVHVCLGKVNRTGRRFDAKSVAAGRRAAAVVSALVMRHWATLQEAGGPAETDDTARLQAAIGTRLGVRLTRRQTEIAMLVLRGHSSASIAALLKISPETVKVFRKQIHKKCNVASQAQLFRLLLPLL